MGRRRKQRHGVSGGGGTTIELNVMPFVDVFLAFDYLPAFLRSVC